MKMNNMEFLDEIAENDVEKIKEKDKEYGSSWKKRGGIGAFHMLARKWDRLEVAVKIFGDDIFRAIEEDERVEGVLDDVRDLRRYLMLVESEIILISKRTNELRMGRRIHNPGIEEHPNVMRDSDYDTPLKSDMNLHDLGDLHMELRNKENDIRFRRTKKDKEK